ncbi:MAG TPA: beta-galactosidase GalB [Polyangiaceae bacterium]|nr:beta-galactosidase GalB [Polyangiaceae bacterium]
MPLSSARTSVRFCVTALIGAVAACGNTGSKSNAGSAGSAGQVAGGTAGNSGTATAMAGATSLGGDGGVNAGSSSSSGTSNDGGAGIATSGGTGGTDNSDPSPRTRRSLADSWRFKKGDPTGATGLGYSTAKPWVLPTGNAFLKDSANYAKRPSGNLGDGVSYITANFDDSAWQSVNLPHDYAIEGPFTNSISASMGRLPATGVAWYRKTISVPASDAGKSSFLDIDGAMSYSMVWVNGQFVGGWPYGYASYRLNLTPYLKTGDNVLSIRLDNPVPASANWDDGSSRWYPGAGIYRNVWLVVTDPVHVGQWGTHVTTPEVSSTSATVKLDVSVDNDSEQSAIVSVATDLFELDATGARTGSSVATIPAMELTIAAHTTGTLATSGTIASPKLWGSPPQQKPNRYAALTRVNRDGKLVDSYETRFGVRTLKFDSNQGFFLNGEHIKLNGVCNHHDLGALGTAVSDRALERQFQILAEMGTNAIRTSHNPPAPELLELADRFGFLIMDEAFDVWNTGKAKLDHHVFFPEWHEQDLRAFIRRDRNHPSVVMWSIGNEIVEQNDSTKGPALAKELTDISHQEDATRPTVSGMNSAKPDNPFSGPIDSIGLNYQGTKVRTNPPQYPTYHTAFPNKFIVGTETASTFSSRGIYSFPVVAGAGTPATSSAGIIDNQISSYDLYFADWSYAPDLEFQSQEKWAYVGGEFVWTGFDYLGEPTPLDSVARSSYFGIIDLAGFKKDRFYLYQARWRPEFAMAHILPHWTWPDRVGQVTPVHVYTSGDEAELFLNGTSLGRKKKAQYEYRLRWDDVKYASGELSVIAYKDGKQWATDKVSTAGAASKLTLTADRATIQADGKDLSFVTLTVEDQAGLLVPNATNTVHFDISGPGVIVATDNGDPTDRTVFPAKDRAAFSGKALAVVRTLSGQKGMITVTATTAGLTAGSVAVVAQ